MDGAAGIHAKLELLDRARGFRAREPDGDEHEVGKRGPVPEAVAALVERIRRLQALGRRRPRHDLARASSGRPRVAVEHGDAARPLPVGVAHAIHRRVAAADDHDVATRGADRVGARARGSSLVSCHPAVAPVQVVSVEATPWISS
jgi:hypothetical protein